MNHQLAQYIQRSPRYVLVPQDQCLIRLAGPKQSPWEEGTEIRDVSTSGLSFTAPADLCPNMSEMIRVEFTVPGSKQMACFAKVVRIEPFKKDVLLVAVEFELLNSAQRWNLQEGMNKKVKPESESVIEVPKTELENPWIKKLLFISILFTLCSSVFLLFGIYKIISQPNFFDSIARLFH